MKFETKLTTARLVWIEKTFNWTFAGWKSMHQGLRKNFIGILDYVKAIETASYVGSLANLAWIGRFYGP